MGSPYGRRVRGDLFTLDVEAPRIHRCRHIVSSVFKRPQRARTKTFSQVYPILLRFDINKESLLNTHNTESLSE
jgi:hypothetical protein